jgi:hypothetical protein
MNCTRGPCAKHQSCLFVLVSLNRTKGDVETDDIHLRENDPTGIRFQKEEIQV